LKFTIEILRDGSVVDRAVVDLMKPLRAKVAAERLLSAWEKRGATVARVLNRSGEEIFIITR
jgi:hypothetical protein